MPSYLNGEFKGEVMLIVFPAGLCIFDLQHLETIGDLSVWSV